jgi:hypothetical protein
MDKPPLTSLSDSELPEPGKSAYGLQVVYQGGIDEDLDAALYECLGRDSNDEGCTIHSGRRDMFWRCGNIEESLTLRMRLVGDIGIHPDFQEAAASRVLVFAVKTENDHWDEKLSDIDRDPRATATPNPPPTGQPNKKEKES